MSTFLIIVSVILWVGIKAYRKANVEFADSEESDTSTHRPAFESLFEEEASPSATAASPYFTYETAEEQPPVASSASAAAVQAEPDPISEAPAFDLRQAVIYQTILNNNYISDTQYQVR